MEKLRPRYICNPNYGDLMTAAIMIIALLVVSFKDYLGVMFLGIFVSIFLAVIYIIKRPSFVFYDSYCEIKRLLQKDGYVIKYSEVKRIKLHRSTFRGGHKMKIFYYKGNELQKMKYVLSLFPVDTEIDFFIDRGVVVEFY